MSAGWFQFLVLLGFFAVVTAILVVGMRLDEIYREAQRTNRQPFLRGGEGVP